MIQLLMGTLLPLVVLSIVGYVSRSGPTTITVLSVFYLLNPMFTFYLTNYLLVIEFINTLMPDNQDFSLTIPLVNGFKVTFRNSLICYCVQTVIFLTFTIMMDRSKSQAFRSRDRNKCKVV